MCGILQRGAHQQKMILTATDACGSIATAFNIRLKMAKIPFLLAPQALNGRRLFDIFSLDVRSFGESHMDESMEKF